MPGSLIGKHVLYDVSMVVNAVDLSDHVEAVAIEVGTNKQFAAAMSEVQDYDMPGTLVVPTVSVTFYNDFNTAKVYQTLEAAWIARTTFNIVAKGSSGANAPTNPAWTIPVFLEKLPIFSAKRGDRHMAPVTFAVAGAVTIATS